MSRSNASTFDLAFKPQAIGSELPEQRRPAGPGRPRNDKLDELEQIVHNSPGIWFAFATVPYVTVGEKRRASRLSSNLRTGMTRRGVKLAQRIAEDGNTMTFYAQHANGA